MCDPIDRQAAIDAIFNDKIDSESLEIMTALGSGNEALTVNMTCDRHMQLLSKLPSVQPEHNPDDERKIADLHKIVNYLLSQSEQRWIPCSERLPHGSCSDLVNVSIHDDSGDTPLDYTSCGWVTTDGEYWIVDNEINNNVVAWMPLPEPWKGEDK